MNTPTPETDAAELTRSGWVQHIVPTEFARKLERERDESRRQMWNRMPHMCRDGHQEIWHGDSQNEMCPLCRALAERDELKLKLAYLEADNQEHIKRDMQRTAEVEQLRKVADELADSLLNCSPMEHYPSESWSRHSEKRGAALSAYNELPHVKKPLT